MIKKIIFYITLTISTTINIHYFSQDTSNYLISKLYGFENINGDSISNIEELDEIYESLYVLKNSERTQISFFHIGDSHIQADYITHTIRTNLQKQFGNAGRGLIIPLKIAKTNESFNYSVQSKNNWKRQLIISKKITLPIGVTGATIQTRDSVGNVKLKTFNTDSLNYSFNKIQLIYDKDSSFSFWFSDTLSKWQKDSSFNTTVFSSSTPTNQIYLEYEKSNSTQSKFTLFGFNVTNQSSGLIYHSTGINGAKFSDYNKPTQFSNQLQTITPKLIIISLGTNEAFLPDLDTTRFYLTIDSLISKIKLTSPNSKILLTTPADSYKNHKKNTNLKLISNTIVQYAIKNDLPYWDLFQITGGEESALNWKKNLLLSRDGVHYTKNGYILQGQLFTLAFLKGYNQYVKHRLQ